MNASGTGLGLFISRKIVQQLGPNDNFEIKSKVGVGSTFSFWIYTSKDKEKCITPFKSFSNGSIGVSKCNTSPQFMLKQEINQAANFEELKKNNMHSQE